MSRMMLIEIAVKRELPTQIDLIRCCGDHSEQTMIMMLSAVLRIATIIDRTTV